MALSADGDMAFLPSMHARTFPVAADQVIYAGAYLALDRTDGFVYVPTENSDLVGVGWCTKALNTTGAADGEYSLTLRMEPLGMNNSEGADEITQDNVDQLCYLIDDDTVALTSDTGARGVAGRIHDVKPDGKVYVYPAQEEV